MHLIVYIDSIVTLNSKILLYVCISDISGELPFVLDEDLIMKYNFLCKVLKRNIDIVPMSISTRIFKKLQLLT